jgi:hypothetical protein
VYFPADSLPIAAQAAGAAAAYAPRGGAAEVFFYADSNGRYSRMGLDISGDGMPDKFVDLDTLCFDQCRHLVIVLDGFGYDVVKDYYDRGHLRLFHPPSRVIAPYPTLTDLCMEDMLAYMACPGMEARYYNRASNRERGGALAYMQAKNEPYARLMDYKADLIWDAIAYVLPWQVFGRELNELKREFDRRRHQEVLSYIVSSAGVSTADGAEGQRRCLERVEQLCHQIVWETGGLTKITLLADHGHSYTPARRVNFEEFLKGRGYRLTESLNRPEDVVYIRFGLETYASFATLSPAKLAADMTEAQGVELASYADGADVVVLSRLGGGGMQRAVISRKDGRYKYAPSAGDPLSLAPVLATLRPDAEGFYDEADLFAASLTHQWPDPLERLWRAHFAMVENPPDVIVSLADAWYSGSKSFATRVDIGSTHGSLNRSNSTTFIMSTIGPLPAAMRTREIPANISKLTGEPFPWRR